MISYSPSSEVSIAADSPVAEPAQGTTPQTFTVTLPAAQQIASTIDYRTVDGSATAAAHDYTPVSNGSLVIPAGQITGQIRIDVQDGSGAASNSFESYRVQLTGASGGLTISSSSGAATGEILIPGISGTVSDTRGKPLAGAILELSGMAGSGDNVKRRVSSDPSGHYSLFVDPGSYTLTATPPAHRGNLAPSQCSRGSWIKHGCRLDLEPAAREQVDFTEASDLFLARPRRQNEQLNALSLDATIDYAGDGWNPKDGPVKIALVGGTAQPIATKAAPTFNGSFQLPDWRTPDCTAQLEARQGKVARRVELKGKPVAKLLAGRARIGKRSLSARDPVCAGESTTHFSGEAILAPAAPNLGLPPGYFSSGEPEPVRLPYPDPEQFKFGGYMVIAPRDGVLPGVIAPHISAGRLAASGARVPVETLIENITRDRTGVVHLSSPVEENPLQLVGYAYSAGSLDLRSVKLDGAVIAVDGAVHIHGSLAGVGAIFATGPITVDGRVALRSGAYLSLVSATAVRLQ